MLGFARINILLIMIGILTAGGAVSILTLQQWSWLLPFVTIAGYSFLIALTLHHNPKSPVNRSYSSLCACFLLWTMAIFFYGNSNSADQAVFWARSAGGASFLIPLIFLYFVMVFPNKTLRISNLFKTAISIYFLIFYYIEFFTPWVVQTAGIDPSGKVSFVTGPLTPIYFLHFLILFGLAFRVLFQKRGEYSGVLRVQINYIIGAFLLCIPIPLLVNIVLPIFGHSEFSVYGPIFLLLNFVIMGYVIIHHKLMDIEIVLKKTMVYSILSILLTDFFLILIYASENFFRNVARYNLFFPFMVVAFVLAVIFQPLKDWLQKVVDRWFQRSEYEYRETLKHLSRSLTSHYDLSHLLKFVSDSATSTMKVEQSSVYLLDEEARVYRRQG